VDQEGEDEADQQQEPVVEEKEKEWKLESRLESRTGNFRKMANYWNGN
jgi:hypothetical protein